MTSMMEDSFGYNYQRISAPFMHDDASHSVMLIPNTPLPLVEEEHSQQQVAPCPVNNNSSSAHEEDKNDDEDDDEDKNEEEGDEHKKRKGEGTESGNDEEARKMPRVVSVLAAPSDAPKRGKGRSRSKRAADPVPAVPQCKGGCGRPPVLPLLCVQCQQVMCLSCSLQSGACPKAMDAAKKHAHFHVEYIAEMLRVMVPDSKQLDTWTMMCAQDLEAWLSREKKIRVWFNPQWNGSVEQRVKLLQRVAIIAELPEADRRPALQLKPDGTYYMTRTHSEPAFFEEGHTTLLVAVTFPGIGCFSLAKPNNLL